MDFRIEIRQAAGITDLEFGGLIRSEPYQNLREQVEQLLVAR